MPDNAAPDDGDTLFIDDPWNADWIKAGSWDLMVRDKEGDWQIADTLGDLLELLDVEDASEADQRKAVEHFLTLPAAIPMPDVLKTELEADGYKLPDYVKNFQPRDRAASQESD